LKEILICGIAFSIGPISSVTVMGQTIVIINEAQVAIDILDKRSIKYSTRPRRVFAGEMYGYTTEAR
jgi:hypothetical protein